MKPIAVLQHNEEAPPGYLGDAISAKGLSSVVCRLFAGDPLPQLEAVSAVVVLGGSMGAYEEQGHPYLVAEKKLIREAVKRDIPILGICLGSQLLADALGGRAYRARERVVGFFAIDVAPAAKGDPVIAALEEPVLSFHGDTFDLPAGTEMLASHGDYPHAFRHGSALAIQSHPEVSSTIVQEWVGLLGRDRLIAEGIDPDAVLADMAAAEAANARRAAAMFSAWLEEVVAAQG
ncbi:MAG: type 1 glutamine amidotransferase [Acidimicrobiia bacterium]|nr:type 1 glutamine amidotransferase [Acidimicrobiia bacterium]